MFEWLSGIDAREKYKSVFCIISEASVREFYGWLELIQTLKEEMHSVFM